jgi:hypothetical protein
VHLLSWLAWASAAAHAVGIGTDLATPSGLAVVPAAVCLAAVVVALGVRLGHWWRSIPTAAWERSA